MLRLLFAFPLLFLGCQSSPTATRDATPAPTSASLSPSAEWSGQHSGVNSAGTQIIRDNAAWSALWQQIGRAPPQRFDPSRETAVALFLGQRRTGGYRVQLASIQRDNTQIVLAYHEETPAPDAMVTQVISSPWAVILLPIANQPVIARHSQPERGERKMQPFLDRR